MKERDAMEKVLRLKRAVIGVALDKLNALPLSVTRVCVEGCWIEVPIYRAKDLLNGQMRDIDCTLNAMGGVEPGKTMKPVEGEGRAL